MDALTLQTLFPAPESKCAGPPPYSAHLARDSAIPSHAGLNSLAPTDAKGSQHSEVSSNLERFFLQSAREC